MRAPAPAERARRTLRQRVTQIKTIPAPVGGWNARDPLAAMKPVDAVVLRNWFPRVADCAIRGGAAYHLTATPSPVRTLITYSDEAGGQKLFAATNGGIFDATSSGVCGASVATSTNGYWQHVQMGTSGGQFLLMANGTDLMLRWDGAVWTNPAITGPAATSDFVSLGVYKRRLFLLEKNVLSFWYLAADSVAGAATEFLLGPLCKKGGYTMAVGTWSLDAGDGPDDYIAFVTSEGQIIIYTGLNPADSAAWALVGVYDVGKPLGRKCFLRLGGDLVYISEQGATPLSTLLKSATLERTASLTNKIENAFTEAARTYGTLPGWEGIVFPAQSAVLFNIPTVENLTSKQYVMNAITKAWCEFEGWNANCFALLDKELYFGGEDYVALAWTGHDDFDTNIVGFAQTAYNYFTVNARKKFHLVRPLILTDGNVNYSLGLSIDFRRVDTLGQASFTSISGAIWDVSKWDEAFWASSLEIVQDWQTTAAYDGYCASLILRVDIMDLEVQWVAVDYIFESLDGFL